MNKLAWFALALLITILDQATKLWALNSLVGEPYIITKGIDFTLAFNTGAAFSFLSSMGGWQRWFFSGFSLIMSIIFIIWLIGLPAKAKLQGFALSLLLGGAIGNLYDRLFFGRVVDFIHLYYKQFDWPVFNVADTAICIGAFCLMLDLMRKEKQ